MGSSQSASQVAVEGGVGGGEDLLPGWLPHASCLLGALWGLWPRGLGSPLGLPCHKVAGTHQ